VDLYLTCRYGVTLTSYLSLSCILALATTSLSALAQTSALLLTWLFQQDPIYSGSGFAGQPWNAVRCSLIHIGIPSER